MDRIEDFEVNSPRWLSLEDFEGEVWKPINGEGLYKVSNCGRVRTIEYRIFKKGRGNSIMPRDFHSHIMKAHNNGHGYLYVNLGGRKYNKKYIHRLVATAFIPNPQNKHDIDHINTKRSDNRLCNLRWVNKSENALNPITRSKNSIAQSEPIVLLNCWGEYVGEYYGIQAAAAAIGVKRSVLNDAISRKRSAMLASGYTIVRKKFYDKDKNYSFFYKRGTSPYLNIPTDRMVLAFKNKKLIRVFPNTSFASKYYGVGVGCISNRCRNDFFRTFKYLKARTIQRDKFMYFKDASEEIKKQALSMFREKYENLEKRTK